MAYTKPQKPGGHMTPKATKLSGPGGYTTNTPTLKGSAGALKPMVGSRATSVHRGAASPFSGGRRGSWNPSGQEHAAHHHSFCARQGVVNSAGPPEP